MTFAQQVASAMFGGDHTLVLRNKVYRIHKKPTGLRYLETAHYLYIEQNPRKQSKWATMARAGHHIMWVIKKPSTWVGQVVDGQLTRFRRS
jgi:hypothetical protein